MIYYIYRLFQTMRLPSFSDTFNDEDKFYWFVKRVNKYTTRYDFLPDGHVEKVIEDETDEDGELFVAFTERLYKVYDKYSPNVVIEKINWEQTKILIDRLLEEDLAYQRAIYDYCHN